MSQKNRNGKSQNQNKNDKGSPKKKKGRAPDYRVVTPKPGNKEDEVFWTRIGSAWTTDGDGISISLNALPLGDRIMLFPNEEENESGNEE